MTNNVVMYYEVLLLLILFKIVSKVCKYVNIIVNQLVCFIKNDKQ